MQGAKKVKKASSKIQAQLDKFRARYPNADPPKVALRLSDYNIAGGYRSAGFNFAKAQLELMAPPHNLSEQAAFEEVERRCVRRCRLFFLFDSCVCVCEFFTVQVW